MEDVSERQFLVYQNRFRGLISKLRSKRFVEKRTHDPIQQFRSGLNNLYLDMRAGLSREQYPLVLRWVTEQFEGQLKDIAQAPLGYDEVAGICTDAPSVSLDRELLWISHRIRMNQDRLAVVSQISTVIALATLNGKYEAALAALTHLQEQFGVSLWSVQLRLALEQQVGGLERQKRYSAEVRKVYKRGVLNFTTYHTSVRNEDRTTLTKFLDDVEGRIGNHQYFDNAVKTYARYRLKGEFPPTDSGLADLLKVEQSHSIVDIYETFISVLQEIVGRGVTPERRQVIEAALGNFETRDFRAAKIMYQLDPEVQVPAPVTRSSAILDALLSGRIKSSALLARRALKTSIDPWDLIYGGLAYGHHTRWSSQKSPIKPSTIMQAISCIFGRAPNAADAATQLSKLVLNFGGMPFAAGLAKLDHMIRRVRPDGPWTAHRIGLNSPSFGIEDIAYGQPIPAWLNIGTTDTRMFWQTILGGSAIKTSSAESNQLALACHSLLSGDFERALEATRSADSWRAPLRDLAIQMRLHAFFARGDRTKVIALIAREGARGSAYDHFLPIAVCLDGLSWPDYKQVKNPLAASVALHLLWSQNDDGKIASLLRFAIGQSLRTPEQHKPSTMGEDAERYSRDELIYYLRYVCVQNLLDQSRVVSGTRAIMEERQAICSLLIELDVKNSASYNEEITSIAEQLAIDEGQWIVDSTRIYVDTNALLRWAKRELQEDFGRYRDLTGVEVGQAQSFDDVLRELMETNPANRTAYTPESEADAVLVSILRRLGQEFLSNPLFGLDFNLSKRIRHQSFVGLIRGPIDMNQIITTRESEAGEYRPNEYWLRKFSRSRDEIDKAFRRFAAHFDDTLSNAKDSALHLRSPEKPDGLIVLNLSSRHIAIAHAIIGLDVSFEEFLLSAMTILWRALDTSLEAARHLISVELKAKLIERFDELRASVRKVSEGDPAFFEFDAAVGNGSTEVQTKLDEAANWFQHADRIRHETAFTLQQVVKIAVDTALKSQRSITPNLTYKVDGDFLMYAGNLIFVHDVLFVALGNAQKHTGLKSPKIDVHVRYDDEASTLMIEAICDSRASNRSASETRIKVIRKLIDSGLFGPRTRKDELSGFVKLAAVVNQSKKGSIDFGYTDDGRFRLSVVYGLTNFPDDPTDAE